MPKTVNLIEFCVLECAFCSVVRACVCVCVGFWRKQILDNKDIIASVYMI